MIDHQLREYARRLGADRPDVVRLLAAAARSAEAAQIAKSVFRTKLRRAGLDPDDNDPFAPSVATSKLNVEGMVIGRIHETGDMVSLSQEELRRGMLITGCHGSGKTNLGYWLAEGLANQP